MADFPDVPDVAGVPTIARDPNNPIAEPQLLDGDSVTVTANADQPEWSLTLNGQTVVPYDSFVSFEYKQDWALADYQVEAGTTTGIGFETYDKVQQPFDARLVLSCGGSVEKRQAFLAAIDKMANDLNLYDVTNPETVYQSLNVQHYDFRRTNINGVNLIQVNLYMLQIRDTATQQFNQANTSPASQSATQDPGAAAQKNDGVVQATTPSSGQSAALLDFNSLNQPAPSFQ